MTFRSVIAPKVFRLKRAGDDPTITEGLGAELTGPGPPLGGGSTKEKQGIEDVIEA